MIGSGDELVARVSLYKSRHPALHGYTSPFIVLYLAWLYTWLGVRNREFCQYYICPSLGVRLYRDA